MKPGLTVRRATPKPSSRSAASGSQAGWKSGFTLLELLVTIAIVAVLAALSLQGIGQMRSISQGAYCANSLRQLWYFGFETTASLNSAEGDRSVDVTQSPLYPYVNQVGGVEVCPAFPYAQSIWKPKYAGASWGYGFNIYLSGVSLLTIAHPSQIMLFGDCAQVNTFQAPASSSHPMLEEFYRFDATGLTTHFRHGGSANILFLDGHVEKFTLYPGTLDTRLPGVTVGRFTPVNSTQYLQ